MRPPILRWKVVLALVGVVAVGAVLGSVLGPAGQASSAGGRYLVSVHIGRAIPVSSPSTPPPRLRRQMCANLRAEMPKMRKAVRRELARSMPGFCKPH